MKCPHCNAENPAGKKFCGDCGAALANICPKCSADNPAGKSFCGECGFPITDGAEAAPSKPNVSAPGTRPVDGERRHLTVLFCDLVGSTAIASHLDPEQWHEIAADYQRSAAEATTRFGGHVAKYLGDGLVVYFGYPTALEDAAERAVRAALAMVESTVKLNDRFAKHKVKLQVRVGIHTGSVVVAQGGGTEADMFGDAPNIASRVQSAAAPNNILITESTHNLVSGLFVVEDQGAQPLKGIETPMRLYRIDGAGVSRRRGFAARSLAPFVGRNDEMQLLARRWERVRDGEGQLVLVMGEPGIGKSRLIEEFRTSIKGEAHLWVACACEDLFSNTPFHAVTQMLDQGLGWRGDESKDERFTQLERALEATGLKLDEAVPLISELLDLPLSAKYSALKLAADQKRKRLLAALAGWVFGAGRIQPLVIVIEDLHWADPSTLEWLKILAEQGATAPFMLVCTARPEFRAPWPMRAHHAQVALNRLNDRQTRELVAGFAAHVGLLADVVESVVKRTDGVPLFAEELTRLMLDTEHQTGAHQIPETLQDSLTARLDRLGPAKSVAQIGSVIGREFSYELLHAVSLIDETELQSSLATLADAELIFARGFPPDATYQFKHALIQDAAYSALLKSKRSELHARIAQTMIEIFPTVAEAQPQVLARHWTDAGEVEPAIASWTKAAKAEQERGAVKEAEEAFREALALLATLPESLERDAREIDLLIAFIAVVSATHSWSSSEIAEPSSRLSALAEKGGNLLQVVLQRFGAVASAWASAEFAKGRTLADQMFDLARREGSDFSIRCAHEAQIWTRYAVGDFSGVESHYREWLVVCERAGYGPFLGETSGVWSAAAHCAWHLGRANVARERSELAVAFAQQSSNPHELAFALSAKATVAMRMRDPKLAEAAALEALAIADRHGLAATIDALNIPLAWARAQLGDAEQSVSLMRKSIANMIDVGERRYAADSLVRLAHVLDLIGAPADALTTVEQFLTEFPDHVLIRSNAVHLRGELRLKLGMDGAENDFQNAIMLARKIGTKPTELRAVVSLARLWQSRAKRDDARNLLAPVYASFVEGSDTRDLKDAKALLNALA